MKTDPERIRFTINVGFPDGAEFSRYGSVTYRFPTLDEVPEALLEYQMLKAIKNILRDRKKAQHT